MFTPASRLLQQMLDLHGAKTPELYKIAADWEFKNCKCPDKARTYLLMGIHMHTTNKLLHKEAFRFELEDSSRKRMECLGTFTYFTLFSKVAVRIIVFIKPD